MDEQQYIEATRRTDPVEGYEPGGAIALRIAKYAALMHYASGLSTEAAEVLDAMKRAVFYGKPLDEVNLLEEIGDLQWYEARILDTLGSSFADVRARNIAKLRKRYPDGFTDQDASERDLDGEREILEANASDTVRIAVAMAKGVRVVTGSTISVSDPVLRSRVEAVITELSEVAENMRTGIRTGIEIAVDRLRSVVDEPYQQRAQESGFDKSPDHYDGDRETIDVIRDSMCDIEFAGFCRGNAIKYEQRAGQKGDPSGDEEKARWYRAMAAHVCGYGEDPRTGRDEWDDDLNGYHRTTAAAVSLASVDDINDLARWIWPDLHAVDGRYSKLVSAFEDVLRKDNRLADAGVIAILSLASDNVDSQTVLAHTKPQELADHIIELKRDGNRLAEVLEVIDRVKLYSDDDPVARARRVIGHLKNERDISRKLLLRARHALDEWTREGVVNEGLLKSIERHLER